MYSQVKLCPAGNIVRVITAFTQQLTTVVVLSELIFQKSVLVKLENTHVSEESASSLQLLQCRCLVVHLQENSVFTDFAVRIWVAACL